MSVFLPHILRLSGVETGALSSTDADGVVHIKRLPFFSVVQALEGNYDIRLDEGETHTVYGAEKGIFLAPAGVLQTITHHTDPGTGKFRGRWLFFDLLFDDTYPAEALYRFPVTAEGELRERLTVCLDRVFGEEGLSRDAEVLKLFDILTEAGECIYTGDRTNLYRALQFMEENHTRHLSVREMAAAACLSEPGFYRSFREEFRCPPLTWLNNYRLSRGAMLLQSTSLPVGEIAAAVGFEDPFYFSRLFRRCFTLTPAAYRKNIRRS